MKFTLLAVLFITISSQLFGQQDRLMYSIEYSPNFSTTTGRLNGFLRNMEDGYRLAHNVFLKSGYRFANNLYATAGIGYFNIKNFYTEYVDYAPSEIDKIESLRTHGYIVAPLGLMYQFGSFYINPEIGIGWNVHNRYYDRFYYSNGSVIDNETVDEDNIYDVNTATYPVLLTFGNEIIMKNCSVLLGIKGYYSLNEIGNYPDDWTHYYGFGIVCGIKF